MLSTNDSGESSIDGELEELLRKNGITSKQQSNLSDNNKRSSMLSEKSFDLNEVYDDLDSMPFGDESRVFDSSTLDGLNSIDMLLPACLKLNKILGSHGYNPLHLTTSDVNMDLRTMSVFVIDSWAESLFSGFSELIDRQNELSTASKDASIVAYKSGQTTEVMQTRISDLQQKLLDSEKKERVLLERVRIAEENAKKETRIVRDGENQLKKKIKNMELLLQENERKVRQRDIELSKVTEKLRLAALKDKEAAARRSSLLAKGSPNSSLNSTSGAGNKTTAYYEALEVQYASMQEENKALTSQVVKLSDDLRRSENKNNSNGSNNGSNIDSDDENSNKNSNTADVGHDGISLDSSVDHSPYKDQKSKSKLPIFKNKLDSPTSSIHDDVDPDAKSEAEIARAMYDKIKDQQRLIDQASHRIEVLNHKISDQDELVGTYRERVAEYQDTIENLRMELDTRPSMKAWNTKIKEMKEIEDKLHDVVMMRGESAELSSWRKHLPTSERIKADRRNHELGLWILESLPKSVMKEVLENTCRELDINDISEITNCIKKLKAVVHQVPRMQKFISNTCDFVFPRANSGGYRVPSKPTMEDLGSVLSQWWEATKTGEKHRVFYNAVNAELARREALLSEGGSGPAVQPPRKGAPSWYVEGAVQWSGEEKGPEATVDVLRDLVDFQIEVLRHKNSFRAAEEFIREHPETMVTRLVGHTQYLFDIKQLEGFLPRMNQVYLFTSEMRNFLSAARDTLSLSEKEPDAQVIAKLQRALQKIHGK